MIMSRGREAGQEDANLQHTVARFFDQILLNVTAHVRRPKASHISEEPSML